VNICGTDSDVVIRLVVARGREERKWDGLGFRGW